MTATPWRYKGLPLVKAGYRKRETGEEFLAIWESGVIPGDIAHPICILSPEGKRDEKDDAIAELIVRAVNSHEALVKSVERFANLHHDNFHGRTGTLSTCREVICVSARAALALAKGEL